MPNFFDQFDSAAPRQDPVIAVDPYKQQDQLFQQRGDARAANSDTRAAEADARAAEAARRAQLEWQATHNPDGSPKVTGKPLADGTAKRIEGGVSQFSALTNSLGGFKDEYAGNSLTGELENTAQGLYSGFGSEGQRNWWAQFRSTDNVIRNELFGAALTPAEKASYEATTISPSLDPKIVRENLTKRTAILKTALERQRRFMIANGSNEDAVNILYEPLMALEQLQQSAGLAEDGGKQAGSPPALPPTSAGSPEDRANLDVRGIAGAGGGGEQLATGATRTVEDPTLAGIKDEYRRRLAAGQGPDQLVSFMERVGVTDTDTLRQVRQQAAFRKRYPNVPIEDYDISAVKEVPLSAADQAINAVGQSSVGAYAINAADSLTGSNLDSIIGATGGNAERARLGMGAVSDANPISSALGQVSGGVMSALGGEAALARAGVSGGIARSAIADTGFGAAYGAGSADTGANGDPASFGDRVAGAGRGAAIAGISSLAAQGTANVLGRAVAPTGGELNALYSSGVRPSIGQRGAGMAQSGGFRGAVGNALNTAEQKLQSLPVVGSAIRGTREAARDEYQIGAFNEALKEVGEKLPAGTRPGTDPNQYAQSTFNRVYAQARSGMEMQVDNDFITDLSAITQPISELGPQASAKLKAVVDNNVLNRFVNGKLEGDRYKRVISDLEKRAASFGKGSSAEDQLLASVITDMKFAVENAARRHSNPDSVALLDAADAGYAKLVRIEDAARRRGGDPGTFTPSNLDAAVQNTSGGVRSRQYLKGEALMQDYATQGRALSDTVPNSGTTDRLMAAAGVAGGIAISPKAAGLLGGLLTLYAPGVRNVARSAMAPAGPRQRMIAAQLAKRQRLIGGAASAAAVSQGMGPNQ